MKPLVFKGREIHGYSVDRDGNIWSYKRSEPRRIIPFIPSSTSKYKYPSIGIYTDGRNVTINVHRAVAESLIPRRRPKEFRPEIWKMLNDREKALVLQAYEVNHIDHDTTNYHPSNLEWVSRKNNIEKRNAHYYSYMN